MVSSKIDIPKTQTVALVRAQGQPVEIVHDYPVPTPGKREVLAKILYSGVCQSDLHTARGTATGPDGNPITAIKLPHIGGHKGVARVAALGTDIPDGVTYVGQLVGVRFSSRICRRCEWCLKGAEQHCSGKEATNHLHHEDGAFQEWIVLDTEYLTVLPQDVDSVVIGPVLCAGLTTYKVRTGYPTAMDSGIIGVDCGDVADVVNIAGCGE